MLINTYEYSHYIIEIHQHPIYNDYEFVIKTVDGNEIKGTSTKPSLYEEDAHIAAQKLIKEL